MNAEEQTRHDEFERQQKIRAPAYDGMITLVERWLPYDHIMQSSDTRELGSHIGTFVRRVARYSASL